MSVLHGERDVAIAAKVALFAFELGLCVQGALGLASENELPYRVPRRQPWQLRQ